MYSIHTQDFVVNYTVNRAVLAGG